MSVRIIECTEPTELYRHYDGQTEPQPAYIELDTQAGTLLATYNAEIGNGIPFSAYHGLDRRYSIPIITAEAANHIMREIAPLADRVIAGTEAEWDGSNTVAKLNDDAHAAEDEIEKILGCGYPYSEHPFTDEDLVAVWDVDGAVNGDEVEEYGITADTTDERLDEIAAEITQNLADCGESGVAVVTGLDAYLAGLRQELQEQQEPMSDAEFRVLRESLGLTGDWLAEHLGVSPRTVRHWEQGKYTIPYGVAKELRRLEEETAGLVKETAAELLEAYKTGPAPELVVYRTDEDYLASGPEPARSASWHRAFVARVAQQVPVTIAYDA